MTIFIQKLQNSLPITVYVAIILFATKELVEFIKRIRGNKRKVEAIKEILAEEIELNYWAYKVLDRTINESIQDIENFETHEFYIEETSIGKIRFNSETDIGNSSHPIPEVIFERYDKLMIELAYLNESIFNKVQNGYRHIKELNHIRMSLIETLQDTEENEKETMWSGFLGYAKGELPDIYDGMNTLYRNMKGRELKEFKLR